MPDNKTPILLVDDSIDTLEMIARKLNSHGFSCYSAQSVERALDILGKTEIDLVLTDYKMPKHSGLDLIRHLRDHHPNTRVLMITGYLTIEGSVEAVKF